MENNSSTFQSPYLKVLRFGVCPKCLKQGSSSYINHIARTIHYHCTNPKCEKYLQDDSMPLEVFEMLSYLESHQPESIKRQVS